MLRGVLAQPAELRPSVHHAHADLIDNRGGAGGGVRHGHLPVEGGAHEAILHTAADTPPIRRPELVWQQTGHSAVHRRSARELAELHDGGVACVERRHVLIAAARTLELLDEVRDESTAPS